MLNVITSLDIGQYQVENTLPEVSALDKVVLNNVNKSGHKFIEVSK